MAITKISNPKLFELNSLTDALRLPTGGTGTRPSSAVAGEWRYNTDDNKVEYYDGANWFQIDDESLPTTSTCNYPTTATALYQFEDNINDTCGSHNFSTFNNSAYGTSKFGRAADFNGTNATILSSVGSPEVFTNASGGTLSFWCNPANTTGTKDMWSAHNGAWTGNYGWIIRTDGNVIWALMYNSSGTNCLNTYPWKSTATVSAGSWNHIAIVTNGNTIGDTVKMYINGSFDTSATFSNNFNVNSSQVIQVGDSFNSQWYEGLIDQGRIFPSELSASDILDLYNETGP